MPRDSSGQYSLPSGNPVVTGTIIESDWANTTMNDIATALTDSLSRTGLGGMLVPFRVADGAVSSPSYSFTNSTNSGIYRDAISSEVRIAVNGVDIGQFGPAGLIINGTINADTISYNGLLLVDGTALAPSYSFQNNSGTGMWYDSGNQQLKFSLLGNNKVTIREDGTHFEGLLTADTIGLSGAISFDDGTALAPSITFTSDVTTGIYYHPGTGEMRITVGGVDRGQWTPTGLNVSGVFTADTISLVNVKVDNGSAGNPSYSFNNGTSSGLYYNDPANDVYMSVEGSNRMRWDGTGVHVYGLLSADTWDFSTILTANGSAGAPSHSFTSATNSGMYWSPGNNSVYISALGTGVVRVAATGVTITGGLTASGQGEFTGLLVHGNATADSMNIIGVFSAGGLSTLAGVDMTGDLDIGAGNLTVAAATGNLITTGTIQGGDTNVIGDLTVTQDVTLSAAGLLRWEPLFKNGSNQLDNVATGTVGQVLTHQGVSTAPAWADALAIINSSYLTNGTIRLTGGFQINWGTFTRTSTSQAVSFGANTFSTACLAVVVAMSDSSPWYSHSNAYNFSTTGFTYTSDASNTSDICYIAIGY